MYFTCDFLEIRSSSRLAALRKTSNAKNLLEFRHPMKYLWSPWRMTYIENSKQDGCIFCDLPSQEDGPENLIVHRGRHAYVVINRFPYTSGHVMVVPFIHKPDLEQLDPAIRAEMMELTSRATTILENIYQARSFNIGINIGEAAGAGVKEHVHIHVVPRWVGDTNFMSSVSQTRVLPEALEDTWKRIRAGFKK